MSTLLVLVIVAITVVGITRVRIDTSTESFLPAGDPAVNAMKEHDQSFGGDPVVALVESAEPGELLSPEQLPRLVGLEGRLAQHPDVAAVYGPGSVLNQLAISTQNMLAEISGRRAALRGATQQQATERGASPAEAEAAADTAVTEFERRYGSLLVRGLPAGLPTLHNQQFVNSVLFEEGKPRPQWQFVVPTPNAVAISVRPREGLDQAEVEQLVGDVRATLDGAGVKAQHVTVTGAPAVTASLSDQVEHEVPLLGGLALVVVGICFLLVPWLGARRRRLNPLLITLSATGGTLGLFGLIDHPLSLGVVAFLPILLGIGSDFPAYIVQRASSRRVLTAALASGGAFACLAISPLPFVRDLGLALGIGVIASAGLALLFRRRLAAHGVVESSGVGARSARTPHGKRLGALLLAVAFAVSGWVALPRLGVEADPNQLAAGLPAVNEAQYAEQILGSSGEVNVVLRGGDVLSPEALGWMRQARETLTLEYGDDLRSIVSPPDLLQFLGPDPTPEQIHAGMRMLPPYLSGAVVRPDTHVATMAYGLQMQDLGEQRKLLSELRKALPPAPLGYQVDVAGLPVAGAQAYEVVSDGRYLGNFLGIAVAGLVLLIGLSRRWDALRAIATASLATGWGLAGMWLLGMSLTPLTAALGSLTSAVGCEFAVLLSHAHRRSLPLLGRTVGLMAVAAASAIATVLAASSLAVVSQFGLLLTASVVLSYLAGIVVVRLFPPANERSAAEQYSGSIATTRENS